MNIVFFGSSGFSVPPLQAIAPLLSCVVTRKTKPKGRGYLLEDNEVKRAALSLRLPIIEIESFKDDVFQDVKRLEPDIFVVASFGLIIPGWALQIPTIGPVNIHPSLLPRHRGPSPIQWALWEGDQETGVTFMRMNERMDAGNILYQEVVPISPDDNVVSLSRRLSGRSAELLAEFIDDIRVNGLKEGIIQDPRKVTYTPIITKEMGKIDWSTEALQVQRQIRALVAWPTAYTYLDGLLLKIFDGVVSSDCADAGAAVPGTVLDVNRKGVCIATGAGVLLVREVQLQNKKRMRAYNFAQGYRGLAGKIVGKC